MKAPTCAEAFLVSSKQNYYFAGFCAGPDLLPGSPGTLLASLLPLVVDCSPAGVWGFTAGPDLFDCIGDRRSSYLQADAGAIGTDARHFRALVRIRLCRHHRCCTTSDWARCCCAAALAAGRSHRRHVVARGPHVDDWVYHFAATRPLGDSVADHLGVSHFGVACRALSTSFLRSRRVRGFHYDCLDDHL